MCFFKNATVWIGELVGIKKKHIRALPLRLCENFILQSKDYWKLHCVIFVLPSPLGSCWLLASSHFDPQILARHLHFLISEISLAIAALILYSHINICLWVCKLSSVSLSSLLLLFFFLFFFFPPFKDSFLRILKKKILKSRLPVLPILDHFLPYCSYWCCLVSGHLEEWLLFPRTSVFWWQVSLSILDQWKDKRMSYYFVQREKKEKKKTHKDVLI